MDGVTEPPGPDRPAPGGNAADDPADPADVADLAGVAAARHEQGVKLLEEIADDNTSVAAILQRIGHAQEGLAADTARELSALRADLAGAIAFRAVKDLCTELIGPLTAMEAMLDRADFSDPVAVSGHVRSLSLTLRGVLRRVGAEKVPVAVGTEMFDPTRHRCVAVRDAADSPFPLAAPGTVVRVVEDGYLLNQRPLTPVTVEIQAG